MVGQKGFQGVLGILVLFTNDEIYSKISIMHITAPGMDIFKLKIDLAAEYYIY